MREMPVDRNPRPRRSTGCVYSRRSPQKGRLRGVGGAICQCRDRYKLELALRGRAGSSAACAGASGIRVGRWYPAVFLTGADSTKFHHHACATLLAAVKGKLATLGATRPWTAPALRDRTKYGSQGGAPGPFFGGAPCQRVTHTNSRSARARFVTHSRYLLAVACSVCASRSLQDSTRRRSRASDLDLALLLGVLRHL